LRKSLLVWKFTIRAAGVVALPIVFVWVSVIFAYVLRRKGYAAEECTQKLHLPKRRFNFTYLSTIDHFSSFLFICCCCFFQISIWPKKVQWPIFNFILTVVA